MADLSNPLTRIESYLAGIAGVLEAVPEPPLTRIEEYLKACYENLSGVAQTAAENLAAEYDPEGSYSAGDYVSYEGQLYRAAADSEDPAGEWVPEDWDAVQVMNEVSGDDWRPVDSIATGLTGGTLYGKVYISPKRKLLFLHAQLVGPVSTTITNTPKLLKITDSEIPTAPYSTTRYDRVLINYGSAPTANLPYMTATQMSASAGVFGGSSDDQHQRYVQAAGNLNAPGTGYHTIIIFSGFYCYDCIAEEDTEEV